MNSPARPISEYHEEVLEALADAAPAEANLLLPPPVFELLQPRILDYVPRKSLTLTFVADSQFANPMNQIAGAYIGLALDAAFGMLALLTTRRACASVTFNMSFMRPLPADGAEILVEARLRALTRGVVFLEGKACNAEEKTVATATSTLNVVKTSR